MTRPERRQRGLGLLWHDRAGRFSWLKTIVLLGVFAPGAMLAVQWSSGDLGPRALNEVIHGTGQYAVRLLLLSLAVAPARVVFDWPRLMLVRRMLGLAAACYVLAHFSLYVVDQKFVLLHVVSEILHRFYLTIGFATLLGLAMLSATSTDAMIRRLGRNWRRLHRAIYVLMTLALLHFFLQSKADVTEAVLMAGFFTWLMLWRLLPRRWQGSLITLALLAPVAAVATAGIEAAWYGLATGIDARRVLAANLEFDFDFGLRPSAWVAICGAGVFVVATGRKAFFFEKKKQKTFIHKILIK